MNEPDFTRAGVLARALIFIALSATVLGALGCARRIADYRYLRFYSMSEPVASPINAYRDDLIEIEFWVKPKRIEYRLKNLSDSEPLWLDFERGSFFAPDGSKSALVDGLAYFKSAPRQSLDPSSSRESYFTAAANLVELDEDVWSIRPFFPIDAPIDVSSALGEAIGFEIPLQAGGQRRLYRFRFEVSAIAPINERVR